MQRLAVEAASHVDIGLLYQTAMMGSADRGVCITGKIFQIVDGMLIVGE